MNEKKLNKRIVLILAVIASLLAAVFALAACGKKDESSVKLELDTANVRTTFGVGESFTTDGLTVIAIVDGKRYIATHAEYEVSAPDMSKAGEKKVTIKFMGAFAHYTVTVVEVNVTELILDASKAKTEFVQGDEFSATGLVVTPILSFGESKPIKLSECEITGFDSETLGEKIISVAYRGAVATYTVNVVALAPKSLEFGLKGVRTVYGVGGSFDKTGLTVTVVMNNGETHPVTEFEADTATFDTVGNTGVTVTAQYGGHPVNGEVNVCVLPKSPSQYEQNKVMTFTDANESGETLILYVTEIKGGGSNTEAAETVGWTVNKKADGSTVMDEFMYTYSPDGYTSTFVKCVGEAAIVSGGALQITIDGAVFTVVDNVWHYVVIGWDEIDYITVDATEAKTEYFVDDGFDATGVVVTLHRMSGASEQLVDAHTQATFEGYNGNVAGEKTIIVTYAGKTASYTVNVTAVALASIELDYSNVKTSYLVGDEFSAAGLIVTAVMNNGTRSNVSLSDCSVSGYDLSVADGYTVTVSYGGKSATYTITVAEPIGVIVGISLDDSAAKKEFEASDAFTAAGLIVTVNFEDGSSEVVDASACTFDGYDMDTVGTHTVTVKYGGKTAEYDITVVAARLDRITVDHSAAKREYLVNGTFEYSGLVVTAHYANGAQKTLDESEYTVSEPDMTTVGVKTVTVAYEQKTAEYMIYAIPDVNWDTSKMDLGNQSGTSDTLELFITNIDGGGDWGTAATTQGWYLLKRADGTYSMYEFSFTYVPDRDPQCEFSTQGLDREYLDNDRGGDMFVVIGGLTFRAGADYWHNRVMGW